MSAAPLKQKNGLLSSSMLKNFRAHVSAAPLKQELGVNLYKRPADFRAHVSAAPLKPHQSRRHQPLKNKFPRSRERGPVEASDHSSITMVKWSISALT